MATFLELGLLNYFSIIFPALLVFVIVFAMFEKFKLIGESKTVHAIIAIALAFIVILSKNVVSIINFISPWFVLVFIFVLLLLMVYKMMGATDEALTDFIQTDAAIKWFIFAIGIVIIVAGISHVYGQRLLPVTTEGTVSNVTTAELSTVTGEFGGNIAAAFFHPKVIGLIFILLVAVFTISMLTRERI